MVSITAEPPIELVQAPIELSHKGVQNRRAGERGTIPLFNLPLRPPRSLRKTLPFSMLQNLLAIKVFMVAITLGSKETNPFSQKDRLMVLITVETNRNDSFPWLFQ